VESAPFNAALGILTIQSATTTIANAITVGQTAPITVTLANTGPVPVLASISIGGGTPVPCQGATTVPAAVGADNRTLVCTAQSYTIATADVGASSKAVSVDVTSSPPDALHTPVAPMSVDVPVVLPLKTTFSPATCALGKTVGITGKQTGMPPRLPLLEYVSMLDTWWPLQLTALRMCVMLPAATSCLPLPTVGGFGKLYVTLAEENY
jgi:hypothetical protein